jgi:DNA ligase (NAD+)
MDLQELKRKIDEHNYNYYVLNNPIISDEEFDNLLKQYETLSGRTTNIGSDLTKGFAKRKHKQKVYSLSNTYNKDELLDFINKFPNACFSVEPKYDGLNVTLIYLSGEFKYAITRGDGIIGDDVTKNVMKLVENIPLKINDVPEYFEIGGEIVLKDKYFNLTNYKNKRAGASALLKTYDVNENIKLHFYPFQIKSFININSQYERMLFLEKLGFEINKKLLSKSNNILEINISLSYIENERKSLPFDIDGAVIKIDDVTQHSKIGYTNKYPKWGVAYKFKQDDKYTKLLDVQFQVGRTGVVTPVAILEPIEINGSTIKKASLHNEDFINQLDLKYGDDVYIEKSGEVIPYIKGIYKSNNGEKVKYTQTCPSCNQKLVKKDVYYICENEKCPEKIALSIEHFCSKNAMNIQIGLPTIKKLLNNHLINNAFDLYKLKTSDLLNITGGLKSAEKLYNSIQNSKNQPFENVLYALGIKHIEKGRIKYLVDDGFASFEKIKNATISDFENIKGFGYEISNSLYTYFKENPNIISILNEIGLKIETIKKETKIESNILKNKSFLLTGFKKDEKEKIHSIIIKNGGIIKTSISKNLDYLLLGDKPGGSKMKKAKELNITLLTLNDFKNLLK